jgi:hypothetical protein
MLRTGKKASQTYDKSKEVGDLLIEVGDLLIEVGDLSLKGRVGDSRLGTRLTTAK